MLKRGASAYIVKSVNPVDLPAALRQAVDGNVFTTIGLPDATAAGAAKAAGLTDREAGDLSVRSHVGCRTGRSAKELWVAEQTVKFHLTNVYRKLGVRIAPRLLGSPTSRAWSTVRCTSTNSAERSRL